MDWEFNRITDYFDCSKENNVWKYAIEYSMLSSEEKAKVAILIKNRIIDYMNQISTNCMDVQKIAMGVICDLYKSVNIATYINEDICDYLNVSAKVFFKWIEEYGLKIHFLSNNTFNDYLRPVIVFPVFFNACGLKYYCPHYYAWMLMNPDNVKFNEYQSYLNKYLDDAIQMNDLYLLTNMASKTSYVHLDIDGNEERFKIDDEFLGADGHMLLFKLEPPQTSSVVSVRFSNDFKSN